MFRAEANRKPFRTQSGGNSFFRLRSHGQVPSAAGSGTRGPGSSPALANCCLFSPRRGIGIKIQTMTRLHAALLCLQQTEKAIVGLPSMGKNRILRMKKIKLGNFETDIETPVSKPQLLASFSGHLFVSLSLPRNSFLFNLIRPFFILFCARVKL